MKNILRILAVVSSLSLLVAFVMYRSGNTSFFSSPAVAQENENKVEQATATPEADGTPVQQIDTTTVAPSSKSGPVMAPSSKSDLIVAPSSKSGPVVAPSSKSGTIVAPSSKSGPVVAPSSKSGTIVAPSSKSGSVIIPSSKNELIVAPSSKSGPVVAPSSKSGLIVPPTTESGAVIPSFMVGPSGGAQGAQPSTPAPKEQHTDSEANAAAPMTDTDESP